MSNYSSIEFSVPCLLHAPVRPDLLNNSDFYIYVDNTPILFSLSEQTSHDSQIPDRICQNVKKKKSQTWDDREIIVGKILMVKGFETSHTDETEIEEPNMKCGFKKQNFNLKFQDLHTSIKYI